MIGFLKKKANIPPQDLHERIESRVHGIVQGLANVQVQITDDTSVIIVLDVPADQGEALTYLRDQVQQEIETLDNTLNVQVVITAEATAAKTKPAKPAPQPPPPEMMAHVKKVILVASGKGGVGKSTVAANIAVELARQGKSTGLLDADIYGPSQPRMMGISGQKPNGEQGRVVPIDAHGVKVMSIGLMIPEEDALVWRGPIVQKALMQLTRDTVWGTAENPLDVLIIDMPPGTGDVQLTLAQKVPVSSAVIVSTPQDIALIDARKGIEMFRKVNIPILGVVENMSTHICSNCGHEEHIFGHGGAREEAEKLNVPFLGEIPLSADIRFKADAGIPVEDHFQKLVETLLKT